MTGDFAAAVPLLVVAASANAVRRYVSPATIYTEKLLRRGRWVPTGLQSAGISTIRARDVMTPWTKGASPVENAVTVDPDDTVFTVITALESGKVVVVERDGTILGTAARDLLDAAIVRLGEGRLLPERAGQERDGSGR
jgi:transposase InsO family protein